MTNNKLDVGRLDRIVKKTIEAINNSKTEIYDIAETARKECKKLENELKQLKEQVKELIETVEIMEVELKESKRKLAHASKNFSQYSQEELKAIYEKADNLRIQLAVKREQEQFFIKKRNDIEVRIKEAYVMVRKAENLITQVAAALGYLTGDLMEISAQLEDIQQRQMIGIRIIRAQEDERQRVARDIHDGPAQLMSNVVMKAEICERLMDSDIGKAKEELRNLKKTVRESLQDVRKIIYNLRPMSLDDLGLVPTLQRYIANYQEESGNVVTFRNKGSFENIKPLILLTVFRIVQEAINNINKHAFAENVVIGLEAMDKQLKLSIYDDGKGFDVKILKARNSNISGGFGLLSMQERVELLDGDFQISSEPGRGTRLNITIPFNQEEGNIE